MRLLFIPEQLQPDTNERTPKLREILAESHTVIGIKDRFADHIYNQAKLKILRYPFYVANTAYMFWQAFNAARRCRADLVFCEGAQYTVAGILVSKILGKPCFWDSHGNTVTFCRQLGKSRLYTAASATLERMLGELSTVLITVSEKDRSDYIKMGIDPKKIFVIPTSVDFSMVSRSHKSVERIRAELGLSSQHTMLLFFGSLSYAPNREALDYINEVLAPSLEQDYPNLQIIVAGRGAPPTNSHRIVTVLGFVPNIYDLIRASDICIAPIWSGVGILTKVLDMMAAGKPTVVTSLAKEGIPELADGWNVLIAFDKKDFVEKTKELLEATSQHRELGRRARETILRGYTWDKVKGQLDELFALAIQLGKRPAT